MSQNNLKKRGPLCGESSCDLVSALYTIEIGTIQKKINKIIH